MDIINLTVPGYPYFVSAGSALYRPGDLHRSRSSIGVFDLIYVEYGELYLTDNNLDTIIQVFTDMKSSFLCGSGISWFKPKLP